MEVQTISLLEFPSEPITLDFLDQGSPWKPEPGNLSEPVTRQHLRTTKVSREFNLLPLEALLIKACEGQMVLHVGCRPENPQLPEESLHASLDTVCAHLDGFDSEPEAMDPLRPYVCGMLSSDLSTFNQHYQSVLVSWQLEREANPGEFLKRLEALDTGIYVITVHNALQAREVRWSSDESESEHESLPEDSVCSFTPHTLTNLISRHTEWTIQGLWSADQGASLMMIAFKQSGTPA